ncbi:ABC transporter permease subunit [Sinorhizobium medicae]|nr:ABC transporter permease subunit [Sinorhizobium medicae]MDX0534951.1 ABC transporter permease subunit [Sinorhizobium medicae]MDX0621121.1 ABC transporter permease subunit [Sinorhizobium medicae]MDX0689729.1 ABC transporter permease subunit [Sinorhizobium medicae]MDX0751443.1 ABC transporter permease subunit [Sinorhizobium medicae]
MSVFGSPVRRSAALSVVMTAVVAIVFFFPIYFMLVSAFKSEPEIISQTFSFLPLDFQGLGQFQRAAEIAPLGTYLFNSSLVAAINVGVTLLFSALAGYGFAKFTFPGRTALFLFVISTMMIPTQILVVPLFVEIKLLGWVNSYQGLIVPGMMNAFGVFMMRQNVYDIPDEIIEAARADGAGEIRIFFFIVLPLLTPALASLAIIIFIWSWGNFLWPLVAVTREELAVLATGITSYTQPYQRQPMWGAAMAVATIATLPLLVLFVFFQRYLVKGLTAAAVKG